MPSTARNQSMDSHSSTVLTQELMLNSLASDVVRVLLAMRTPEKAFDRLLLGIGELTGLKSMALFRLNLQSSQLEPLAASGKCRKRMARFRPSLKDPALARALKATGHTLVQSPAANDDFRMLGDGAYALFPIPAVDPVSPRRKAPQGRYLLWLDIAAPGSKLNAQAVASLHGLIQQAALVLENLRMSQELAKANGRLKALNRALHRAQYHIEEDLERARSIQKALLPRSAGSASPEKCAFRYYPAGKVGGDYFDCFEIGPDRVGMVMADVSGHGIAASLIMCMFKVLLKTLAASHRSPARTLQRINSVLLQEIEGVHFITAFFAVFHRPARTLTYANAGHVPQLLFDGRRRRLPSNGLFLGSFPDTFLKDETIALQDRGRLFLYTDGLIESEERVLQSNGEESLEKLVAKTLADAPENALDKVIREALLLPLRGIAGSRQPLLSDDITVAIVDL